MAYSYFHKGTKYNHDGTAWRKIALWGSADNVEVDGGAIRTNLPAAFAGVTTVHGFLAQIDSSFGAVSGFATLDGTGKVPLTQLPVISGSGGLSFQGTIDASSMDLDDLTGAFVGSTDDIGKYFIITTAGTIDDTSTTTKWATNASDDSGDVPPAITLEVGDWLICTGYATDHNVIDVINNAYGSASTGSVGVVQLSDATTRAGLSGDHVVTEGVLATILNGDILVDGDFATAGFMKTNGAGSYSIDNNTYLTTETSHADVVVDGDFTSEGLMRRGATAGVYSIDSTTYQKQVTISAIAPSGGAANDIWIVTS
jgi:hypothetical protein